MNEKRLVTPIIPAVMFLAIFTVMIGSVSAFTFGIGNNTITGPGGTIDNSLEYLPGDTIFYRMSFSPTSEDCTVTLAKDIFADGSEELIQSVELPLYINQEQTWETSWYIPLDWDQGKVVNNLRVEGKDSRGAHFIATAPTSSKIVPIPAAIWLLGSGLLGLVGLKTKFKK